MKKPFVRRIKHEKIMRELGQPYKVETKRLIKEWRSDWTRAKLAAFFGVIPNTIVRWARKHGLKYQRQGEQMAKESYALRPTSKGVLQITFPQYLVKKMGLLAGDKLRYELKKDKCLLRKERNRRSPAAKISAERRTVNRPAGPISKQERENLLAKWRSDLTAKELAARFGVPLHVIYYWAGKYNLDRPGKRFRRCYSLRENGRRGHEIIVPLYIVNGLNLKAGDRMRFELKKNGCTLSKEKGTRLDSPGAQSNRTR
jgi:bifunctional DNA-binding transcriptional regulator/antitoxin component of YhaV-PrlF toxin-antitoxin module